MTLAELASFSTALSGAVVTASLIYVAIQTHQNNRNIRALIHQGSIARTTSLLTSLADPDQCTAWLEGNGRNATTEAIRARQFYIQCSIAINSMDDVYFQHRSGLLHQAQFVRGSATFRRLLAEPGMRQFWQGERELFAASEPGFTAYVDALIAATG
jgi:hypothetical protein